MNKFLIRGLIALNIGLGLLLLDKWAFASVITDTREDTVLISNEGLDGAGRGTGVLLDATHVLTCAHMVRSSEDRFFIYTYPVAKVTLAKFEYGNLANDLAILVLDSSVTVRHTPEFVDGSVGDNIYVVGNALGSMKWYVTRGIVSGAEGHFLLTDAQIHPGNSGGPWINNSGQIVALTDWTLIGRDGIPTGINGGISAKTINEFLEEWKNPNGALMQLLGLK